MSRFISKLVRIPLKGNWPDLEHSFAPEAWGSAFEVGRVVNVVARRKDTPIAVKFPRCLHTGSLVENGYFDEISVADALWPPKGWSSLDVEAG